MEIETRQELSSYIKNFQYDQFIDHFINYIGPINDDVLIDDVIDLIKSILSHADSSIRQGIYPSPSYIKSIRVLKNTYYLSRRAGKNRNSIKANIRLTSYLSNIGFTARNMDSPEPKRKHLCVCDVFIDDLADVFEQMCYENLMQGLDIGIQ